MPITGKRKEAYGYSHLLVVLEKRDADAAHEIRKDVDVAEKLEKHAVRTLPYLTRG